MFNGFGEFNQRVVQTMNCFLDIDPEDSGQHCFKSHLDKQNPSAPDWKALRPYFGWQSEAFIKDTYKVMTRFAGTVPHNDGLKKHFKARNPVFNTPRRNEAVITDTIMSDTPAVDDGSTIAWFICGHDTLVCDAYAIKSTKQFINTLAENIRKRGAMDMLISDGGKYEVSKKVTDLLSSLFISSYESEPYHQHQNKSESRIGDAKKYTNRIMSLSGCPVSCWLLCLMYVCMLLNITSSPGVGGITPLKALAGQGSVISMFLYFSFYEPVYYNFDEKEPDSAFPSNSNEKCGYLVGFVEDKGDQLLFGNSH